MKYFIDFEAAQFSQEIISIGCIAEDGRTFSSIVKPSKKSKKLTPFIKNLTGISQETIDSAPTADEVFESFYRFLCLNGEEPMQFYCYGNADETYCKKTLKKITNVKAQIALSLVAANLTDLAPLTANHFNAAQNISLKKVIAFIKEQQVEQKHDALEDAEMLLNVYNFISETEPLEVSPFEVKVSQPKPKEEKVVKVICINKHGEAVSLNSIQQAADKAISLMDKSNAVVARKHRDRVEKRIKKAARTNKTYIDCNWEVFFEIK